MPYPRKYLNDGEDVVLDLHQHWWFFASPTLSFVVAVVVSILVGKTVHAQYVGAVMLALMGVTALWWVLRYFQWRSTNFVVTNDRLIFRHGILAKSGREIPLDRVNDISFHQSLFERLIGAGDLMIESAGERGQEQFTDIPRPARVQNTIYSEIDRMKDRDADRAAGRNQPSIPEQIEKLDELHQRGILTQAEFDAKKAQLLDRL